MKLTKLGIQDLDSDHSDFFERSNHFLSQIGEKENIDNKDLSRMNSFFKDYLDNHFSKEEKIQLKLDYPYQKEHKRVHKILKKRVLKLINSLDLKEVEGQEVYEVYAEVMQLLQAHINYIDQGIKKHM